MASSSHPTQTHPTVPPAALSKEDSTATTSSTSTDFEVASPMKLTHTGDPLADRPSVQDAESKLSRHISAIPDDGNEEDGHQEKGLMAKLKAKVTGKKGEEHTHHEAPTRTSEDVEVVGTISGSPVRDGGGLERHISAIPQD
ncbi:hypothetical protein TI39_contig5881g00002 [Zymoseptoria brevis]|uniref:Uncharacterized protein n=1 Tax=Zymoseptoria brevis TaxID=1047168 RepID=A0A0F4G4J0_9PEZI|nr:hypothetical protein TI39_contig5881g00002 [Zymoseptoria brevis]